MENSLFMLVIAGFFQLALAFPGFAQERTWTDSTGTFKVVAELVDVADGNVWLRKQKGNVIKVPIEKFSTEDQAYIGNLGAPISDTHTDTPGPPTPVHEPELVVSAPVLSRILPTVESSVSNSQQKIRLDPSHFNLSDIPPRPMRIHSVATRIHPASSKSVSLIDPQPPNESTIEVSEDDVNRLSIPFRRIGKMLFKGDDPESIRKALASLSGNWPNSNDETILKLVRKTTRHKEKQSRLRSMLLLGKHDLVASLPFILERLNDEIHEIRWAALNLIGQSADPRALPVLIDNFTGHDRDKISTVLMAYGTTAETQLHQFLSHRSADIRMETCLLLGRLGTGQSISKLKVLATSDTNPIVVLQAKSSIKSIKKRLGEE